MTPDQRLIDDFEALFPSVVRAYRELGISESSYYRYRNGESPVPEKVKKSIRVMTWAINMQGNQMSDKTGGPAFPIKGAMHGGGGGPMGYGMTLRDYAAIKAMAAMISTSAEPWSSGYEEHTAENAYRMADAMLSERNKVARHD